MRTIECTTFPWNPSRFGSNAPAIFVLSFPFPACHLVLSSKIRIVSPESYSAVTEGKGVV
jgi:hypothetical protein